MAADLFLSIKKIQMNTSTEVDTLIVLVYNFFPANLIAGTANLIFLTAYRTPTDE